MRPTKKAPAQRPAPKDHIYCSTKAVCQAIMLFSYIIFFLAYHFRSIVPLSISFGALITCSIILVALNPIADEEEDEYMEYI